MTDETIVEDRGITVTKAFDREGFPVPAVTFRVESDRTKAVDVRIVDEIPAEFGIEQIGFHPEYGGEHWTATGEGVVRFERAVEPGEAFTTVYGVKMDDEERPGPFLGAPRVEVDPDEIDESAIEDVVPKESSDVVRELAEGERDSIPGLEDDESEPDTTPVEAEAQRQSRTSVASDDAEIIGDAGTGTGTGSLDDETEETAASDPLAEDEDVDEPESTTEDDILEAGAETLGSAERGAASSPSPDDGETDAAVDEGASVSDIDEPEPEEEPIDELIDAEADDPFSTTDADESDEDRTADSPDVEADDDGVDVDDRAAESPTEDRPGTGEHGSDTAMSEEPTEPTPTDAEPISEDTESDPEAGAVVSAASEESLAATLAAEIRDGTADDEDLAVIRDAIGDDASDTVRVEHLQSRVSDLEAYTDALTEFLDENGRARDLLERVESSIDDLSADIADIGSRVDSAQGEREALRERINSLADDVGASDELVETVDRVSGDLEAIEERVADGEEARMEVAALEEEFEEIEEHVEDVEEDVEDVEADVEEFKEWRSQLSDLFN